MENVSLQSNSATLSTAWLLKSVVSKFYDSSSQTPPLALGLCPESGSWVKSWWGGGEGGGGLQGGCSGVSSRPKYPEENNRNSPD